MPAFYAFLFFISTVQEPAAAHAAINKCGAKEHTGLGFMLQGEEVPAGRRPWLRLGFRGKDDIDFCRGRTHAHTHARTHTHSTRTRAGPLPLVRVWARPTQARSPKGG